MLNFTTFKGGVNFKGAIFKGFAIFQGVIFKDFVLFNDVQFKQDADFFGTRFESVSDFDNTRFGNTVGFCRAVFLQYVNFQESFAKKVGDLFLSISPKDDGDLFGDKPKLKAALTKLQESNYLNDAEAITAFDDLQVFIKEKTPSFNIAEIHPLNTSGVHDKALFCVIQEFKKENNIYQIIFIERPLLTFELVANFTYASFEKGVNFEGVKFGGASYFDYTEFCGKVNFAAANFAFGFFTKAVFKDSVDFGGAKFIGQNSLFQVAFEKDVNFRIAEFTERANFAHSKFLGQANFWATIFEKEVSFDSAIFSGYANFTINKSGASLTKISKFSTTNTIFEAPVLIDLPFKNAPDFSKTRFLKTAIIEETWQNKESNIEKEFKDKTKNLETMENKCRFFKNYFANIGNHFKEIEYFKYEMRARGERLKTEEGRKDLKQNCFDYFLFRCYKIFSDHGTSAVRPLIWLGISLLFFTTIPCFAPYLSTLFCDFIKWTGFKWSLGCNCVAAWKGFSFIDNFKRTIFPLAGLKDFKDHLCWRDSQKFIVIIQIFVNTALLFLVALGLRSKFKIK